MKLLLFVLSIFTEGSKDPQNHAILCYSLSEASASVTSSNYPDLDGCSAYTLTGTPFVSITLVTSPSNE